MQRAHRISYFLFNDELPDGLFICHKCDNTKCVNPDHLFAATPKQNTEDCLSKKRRSKEKSKKKQDKYYGVTFRKENGKWRARYCVNYELIYIGQYNTDIEAAKAYDRVIKEWNRDKSVKERKPLNFIDQPQ